MRVSFDGMRHNIAGSFNRIVRKYNTGNVILHEELWDLQNDIARLISLYDDSVPDDMNVLDICLVEAKELDNGDKK